MLAFFLLFYGLMLPGAVNADGHPTRRFTGVITEITEGGVVVRRAGDVVEFNTTATGKVPQVGDRVTVEYSLKAESIVPVSPHSSQPSEADEEDQLILDDRAFYDAMLVPSFPGIAVARQAS